MVKVRTLKHIINSPWADAEFLDLDSSFVPTVWSSSRRPVKEEIDLWEQIYFKPANMGLYAAFQPYLDFYLLVYNLFDGSNIVEFYGEDAVEKIVKVFENYNVSLPVKSIRLN